MIERLKRASIDLAAEAILSLPTLMALATFIVVLVLLLGIVCGMI